MLTVGREAADTPDAVALVEELTAELATNDYPAQSTHGYDVATLVASGVAFFVARVDGVAAGCGGVQLVGTGAADGDEPFAELKRMYVRPEHRGTGVAAAIMAALLDHARAAGIGLVRLETGVRQHAAIAFYRREGFELCEPFPPYVLDPESAYLERRLELRS